MLRQLIVDSNILLDYPQIIKDEKNIVVITDVLRELDGLKLSSNFETAYKARRAAVMLSQNMDAIDWDDSLESVNETVDDKLLMVTKNKEGILVTNDVYLKVKAKAKNVCSKGYSKSDDYSGIQNVLVKLDANKYNKDLDYILTEHELPNDILISKDMRANNLVLSENEFVIVRDYCTDEVLNCFINLNGKLEPLEDWKLVIYNKWIDKIVPKNVEQKCLFDILLRRQASIVYAGGKFGTGY